MALSRRLLLSGDMQGGAAALSLSGDMAGGIEITNDHVSGGQLTSAVSTANGASAPRIIASAMLISPAANAAGLVDISSTIIFAIGGLAAGSGQSTGAGTSLVTGAGTASAGPAGMALAGGPLIGASGALLSDKAALESVLRVLADASGGLFSGNAGLAGAAKVIVAGAGILRSGKSGHDGTVSVWVGVDGNLLAPSAVLSAMVQTTDRLTVVAALRAGPPSIVATIRAKIVALGNLGATPAQIDAAAGAIVSAAGQMQAGTGALAGGLAIEIRASGALAGGRAGIIAELITEMDRRTVMAIFY